MFLKHYKTAMLLQYKCVCHRSHNQNLKVDALTVVCLTACSAELQIKQNWKLGSCYFLNVKFLKTKFYNNQIFLYFVCYIGFVVLNFLIFYLRFKHF